MGRGRGREQSERPTMSSNQRRAWEWCHPANHMSHVTVSTREYVWNTDIFLLTVLWKTTGRQVNILMTERSQSSVMIFQFVYFTNTSDLIWWLDVDTDSVRSALNQRSPERRWGRCSLKPSPEKLPGFFLFKEHFWKVSDELLHVHSFLVCFSTEHLLKVPRRVPVEQPLSPKHCRCVNVSLLTFRNRSRNTVSVEQRVVPR